MCILTVDSSGRPGEYPHWRTEQIAVQLSVLRE
jgi:hypothetical protein